MSATSGEGGKKKKKKAVEKVLGSHTIPASSRLIRSQKRGGDSERHWCSASLISSFRMTGVTACAKTERKQGPQLRKGKTLPQKTRFQKKLARSLILATGQHNTGGVHCVFIVLTDWN